jgi:hypothetical protein
MEREGFVPRRLPPAGGRAAWWLGLAALGVWGSAALAYVAARAASLGERVAGPVSALAGADQYRYFAWVREAGDHLLISNAAYGLDGGPHALLQPMFVLSGLLWRAGLSVQLAYFVWMPVAVAVLWASYVAYVKRTVEGGPARLAALALALLAFTPLLPLLDWGGLVDALAANRMVVVAGPVTPYWQLWGYFPAAIGLGFMAVYLLLAERVLEGGGRRPVAWAALAGVGTAWVHPAGGLTLLLVTVGIAVWDRFARRDLRLLGPALATGVPLAYYLVLGLAEDALRLGRLQTVFFPDGPLWVLAATLGPFVGLAAIGVRSVDRASVRGRLLLLWPLAAIAAYAILGPNARLLALQGVSLPLAVLATRGAQRVRLPAVAGAAAIAVLVVPGMLYSVQSLRDTARSGSVPYTLEDGDARALRALEAEPGSGPVLAPAYLSVAVSGLAGRRTFVGMPSSPRVAQARAAAADEFFRRPSREPALSRDVRRGRFQFLLAGCRARRRAPPLAGFAARAFGCSVLYVRTSSTS